LDVFAIPIVNGVLPRIDGGVLQGVFFEPFFANSLARAGVGGDVFLFPYPPMTKGLIPWGCWPELRICGWMMFLKWVQKRCLPE